MNGYREVKNMHLAKEKQKRYYLNMALILFFMFGFGFLPPVGPITEYGMHILGVFIGCIYAWMLGEYIWPSVTGLVAIGLCGDNTVTAVLSSAYGNATVLLILWAIIFCFVLQRSGLLDIVAAAILSNRLAAKGPWAFCTIFWVASSLASCVATNCTPVIIMIWSIFYGVLEALRIPRYDKYSQIVMIGIAVFGYMGMVILPVNSSTQLVLGLMRSVDPAASINWLSYIMVCVVLNVVTIPLMVLFFKYVVRINPPFQAIDAGLINVQKKAMNKAQKLVVMYLVILCAGVILPAFLPAELSLTVLLNKIGANGMFVIVNVAMVLTVIHEESLQDIAEAMRKIVPWDVYFMVATALSISSLLVSPTTGISVLLNDILGSLLAGKGAFVFMALIIVIGTVMTNIINNAVTMSLLVPISYSLMQVSGGSFAGLCVLFSMVLLQGVVFPSGSFAGALMHGNSEYLKPVDIYKYASLSMVVLIIVCICVGIPLVNLLF